MDTKAKVKLGPFSRGGISRGRRATRAADHDMHVEATLTPVGILEVDANQLNILFGTSRATSDFVADALEQWWVTRKTAHSGIDRLLIDLDNGPHVASSRTQFMKRMVDFSDRHQLTIELVYYPPYHSKYNPVERCWGILENHWNGTLLSSIEVTLAWAASMTWRGVQPIVQLSQQVYETGVRMSKQAFASVAARLQRPAQLPRWSVIIEPQPAPTVCIH